MSTLNCYCIERVEYNPHMQLWENLIMFIVYLGHYLIVLNLVVLNLFNMELTFRYSKILKFRGLEKVSFS